MSAIYILIPMLPLLAAIIIALTGHRLGEDSRKVGTLAIGLSFAFSVLAFIQIVLSSQPITIPLYQFLESGRLTIHFGLYLDQLSVLVLLLVIGVSFVVHAYSSRYMIGDRRYSRFFALMGLFTFAMVTLVMSSNLLLVFICWELMGICSYLLISHQADRKAACNAATKAFLINAVADVGLLFGIVLVFATFGTLDIREIFERAPDASGDAVNLLGWVGGELSIRTVTLISLCLFCGCLGKSAQAPFHVWLPQAMEAPTPVSALIHAATMVNAGPFLLVRFSPLLVLSPVAMAVIAVIGGTTALFAAIVSLTQPDIKKSLAYSTISQIGFMIMACGLGAFVAAVFHLLAHGVLKAYLFLSTGNQLSATATHSHDEHCGETGKPGWSLAAGAFVLACVPAVLLFSGPYGNLWTSHQSQPARVVFASLGLLTVFCTAIYCLRGVRLLFNPGPTKPIQPRFYSSFHLGTVAVGVVASTILLLTLWSCFTGFLLPALAKPFGSNGVTSTPLSRSALFGISLVAALAGVAIAFVLPVNFSFFSLVPAGLRRRLYVMFLNKFYFDEIYSACVVQPTIRISRLAWRRVDVGLVDRVNIQLSRSCVVIATWFWTLVDVRRFDRAGHRISVGSWDRSTSSSTERSDTEAQPASAQPLQHQLLIQIIWLIVAMTFFYWLVLHQ